MPHFQDQLATPAASCDWVTGSGSHFVNQAATSIMQAIQDHADEKAAKQSPVN
jgi:limonene 1,2-monooxygenase